MTRFLRPSAFLLLAAALMLSLSACDSGGANNPDPDPDPDPDPQEQNEAPTASASVDTTSVTIDTEVTLDASGSEDPDGDDLSFSWTLDVPSGSDATLSDDSAVQPTFTPDVEGDYTATVTVDDGNGESDDASVTITAEAPEEESNAEITFDGDASGAFDGYAYFYEGTHPDTDESIFYLVLSSTNNQTPDLDNAQGIWIARESSRPDVGEHAFAQYNEDDYDVKLDEFVAFAWSVTNETDVLGGFYFADGGTLTITESSNDQVAGSFEINAVGFVISESGDSYEESNLTIKGTFDAESAGTFFFPASTD